MKLKDCLEKIIDNRGRNPKYYDKEVYPVIDNVMIKNNYHPNINESTRFIDQNTHDNFLRGYLEPNLPIMTLVGGGIGNVSLSIDDKSVIVQNTIGFKPKADILDSIYLYYWFLYKHDELIQFNRGSGQPSIRKTDIENMDIDLKDINYQKKVSKILSDIDEKITLNNEINNNLYDMQKCYYKELFKDKLYQKLKLDELFIISAGGDAPKDKQQYSNDEYKYPIVANGIDNDGIYGYSKEYRIDKKSVTISARGTIGFKVLRNYNYYPIVRLISLIPKNDSISSEYLFYALDDIQILGTGTTQQQLTVPMVKDIKIKVYDNELIRKFTDYSISLNKKMAANKLENKNLEQLRDTLLTKLMNGEIDLDNIEI